MFYLMNLGLFHPCPIGFSSMKTIFSSIQSYSYTSNIVGSPKKIKLIYVCFYICFFWPHFHDYNPRNPFLCRLLGNTHRGRGGRTVFVEVFQLTWAQSAQDELLWPAFVRRASSVVRKLFYLNIFSSETTHWILTKLHRNDPWVVPFQLCKWFWLVA